MATTYTSVAFTYKHDDSAGAIPATVHFKPVSVGDDQPRPVVMILHAGGYSTCGTFLIPRNQIKRLTDMGFVVVTPETRLCPQVSVANGPLVDARECLIWIRQKLPQLLQNSNGDEHAGDQVGGAGGRVALDPARVAVMGHSAGGNLAMILGGEPDPPSAILSLYGTLYSGRSFYHEPQAVFAALPDLPAEFTDRVYTENDGRVPWSSPPMMTRQQDGSSKPDLSSVRSAWMLMSLKRGTQMAEVVQDGNYEAVTGPSYIFSSSATTSSNTKKPSAYPPTAILHGTADVFAPYQDALDAVAALQRHGIPHELITVPQQNHMFDAALRTDFGTDSDEQDQEQEQEQEQEQREQRDHDRRLFTYVQRGLDFLQRHT